MVKSYKGLPKNTTTEQKKYNIPSLRKKAVVTIRLAIFTMMNLG